MALKRKSSNRFSSSSFFFHSASACSFPYDGGNSIVSAEFICAVVLFPPYLFQFHTWNQIDRTALELFQICNFSVANDGRCVNQGMKKAAGWVDQSVTFLEKFYLVSVRLHCRSASSSATLLSASAVSFCASIFSFSAESAL